MISVAVNGACGRMGSRIVDLVLQDDELQLCAALEAGDHDRSGEDIGQISGRGPTGVKLASALPDAMSVDVLIDFSAPASTISRATECVKAGAAMIIGTTGLSDEQRGEIQRASESIPCLIAPNMSLGVNVVFQIAAQMAKMLGEDFDIEVIETHHRLKRDAPSGTALRIAERIAEATGRDLTEKAIYGRHGMVGERPNGEIGVHSIRGGDVVGDHTVIFAGLGERVELTHRAHTRDNFARGALRAAKFLAGKPAGMYAIEDVLGIK